MFSFLIVIDVGVIFRLRY